MVSLESELSQLLGTKVRIKTGRKKGNIEIEFYSSDEFERILEILRGVSTE
jgi:ParB family chromosome partitioning protein